MRAALRLLTAAGIAALLVMVAATLVAVVARFFGLAGFEWSYEVAAIAFVWTTFLGAALAEARGENAAFDVLRQASRREVRTALERCGAALLLIVGGALLASGIAALARSGLVPTPLLRWPGFVQSAAPSVLGGCLCVLAIRRLAARGPAPERHPPATASGQGPGTPL